MKLTIEENREAIKRYRHIKPASHPGSIPCSASCPGTSRTCTLKRGHAGPHIAHGMFKRVVAVWDRGYKVAAQNVTTVRHLRPDPPLRKNTGGFFTTLRDLRKSIARREHYIEAALFLVFGLAMVGFAIDWALRIMGLK